MPQTIWRYFSFSSLFIALSFGSLCCTLRTCCWLVRDLQQPIRISKIIGLKCNIETRNGAHHLKKHKKWTEKMWHFVCGILASSGIVERNFVLLFGLYKRCIKMKPTWLFRGHSEIGFGGTRRKQLSCDLTFVWYQLIEDIHGLAFSRQIDISMYNGYEIQERIIIHIVLESPLSDPKSTIAETGMEVTSRP